MPAELAVIFFLLLLNAFFALSEMAIVSASKPLLRQQEKQGKKGARIALQVAENSGRFLSTIQAGITLIGIIAGVYGGATIAEELVAPFNNIGWINPHGETAAVILVVTALTYFSVIIGELVPKQIALNNPEKFAVLVAIPMYWLSLAFSPVVTLLEASARLILKTAGIKKAEETMTETEVKAVIAEGAASGAIEKNEHEIIQRVIRLGDRDITSVMTHRSDVVFIDLDDTLETVRKKIHAAGHSRYPVIRINPSKILGIVKTKELLEGAFSPNTFRVSDYLKEATFVPSGTSCLKALEIFKKKRLNMVVIVDEYGATEGILTTSDLMESIVGVLPSNYELAEQPLIFKRDDGSWLVDGLTPVDEINITIGFEEIPTDADFQTIAGFILHKLKRIPAIGDTLEYAGYCFEIADMDNRRIDKILIRPLNVSDIKQKTVQSG